MEGWRRITGGGLVLSGVIFLAMTSAATKPQQSGKEGDWAVWAASAMERIGKQDPAREQSSIAIRAARGEYEAFQVIVAAGNSAMAGVEVELSDLTGPGANVISRKNLTVYREHYIQVVLPSPDPGRGNRPLGKGWYADALIPLENTNLGQVAPGENQPVWVDVHVPADAAPGTYKGTLAVIADHRRKEVAISLRVWNFALPLTPTLQSSFGMHEPSLHDRRIHEVLLQHRVMPESVNPEDAAQLTEESGLNTTGLRFWSNFNKQGCTMEQAPSPARIAAALRLYPAGLPIHLYSADEIDRCPQAFDTVRNWAAAMHKADPRVKNLVTVAPVAPLYDDGEGGAGVDIWALLPKVLEANQAGVQEVRARGGEIWSYTALVQDTYSPKWEIDFAPINFRIQPGFLSQSLGMTGILYWRVDLWTAAPFQDLRGYSIEGNYYPGEGMLLYPGGPVGVDSVIPSMRLKWIRAGVDDFEYVAILKRLGRGEWALERARRAGTDWHEWTRDIRVVESVRDELGDEIERLSSVRQTQKH